MLALPRMPTDAPPPAARPPLACAGLDTSGGAAFVQQRLALLGKTVFVLSAGFYVIVNGLVLATGKMPFVPFVLSPSNSMHLVAIVVTGALWAIAGGRPRSLATLGLLDVGGLVLCCAAWAMMANEPDPHAIMPVLLATAVTTLARAVLVPSTGARTFWLTTAAVAPALAVNVFLQGPPPQPTSIDFSPAFMRAMTWLNTALWLGIDVALATVTTRTIYGLRRQVKEAADVGQYALEERIGSGGMGEVWRARHRLLIRPAAIKLVRPQALGAAAGDPQVLLRRFEREARATAALKSPNTVQLYDFGVTDDGALYYVMELLEGMDLDALVKRFGPVPAGRAVHLLDQICSSLEDAHRNGLVHRDVKPANVVVSRLGQACDFVKVLDFGLVKLDGARQSEDSVRLTAAGAVSGTPGFMAPEVALGEETTDHRVDLYSLGCVAYWLVTGKLVFEGSTAMKVMLAHAHERPPPPSSRVELPIPPALEALILECLEKDPAKRPPSAAAVQARLRAAAVEPPWTAERAERWWGLHAPAPADPRPAADILLSQEARPLRVIRRARG
jgi:eukaryotic-like serine/threonine-protein kinase